MGTCTNYCNGFVDNMNVNVEYESRGFEFNYGLINKIDNKLLEPF